MTMVWKSGTRRASRGRRLRVCTLATTVGAVMLIARCLHDAERQGRIDEVQLVHGLLDELIAVRQDQGAPAAPLHEQGKQ